MAEKLDLHRKHKAEYVAPKSPALVEVKPAKYLAIDGKGAPGGEDFQAKIAALYSMAFTIKMARKFAGRDYKVCGLESLYWAGRKGQDPAATPLDQWRWKLLIRVPGFIDETDLAKAAEALAAKGKPPAFKQVRIETLEEGPCVQVLHVGPYSDEGKTVARMMEFARAEGLTPRGRHHEIYLSDPRRVPPERLRTLLRQPVRR